MKNMSCMNWSQIKPRLQKSAGRHGASASPGTRLLAMLLLACVAGTAHDAGAQITVKVDASQGWQGYMNWFDLSDAYVGGGGWAIGDLPAEFEPTQADATHVVLSVNTNTFDPADPFWNEPDGTSNKRLEANFYVDVGTDFAGEDVTFEGAIDSNTLPDGWTCEAVIKEFASGYNYIGDTRAALVTGQPFTVTRPIGAGNICQYGFLTYGPNAAPGSAPTLTSVRVPVDYEDPSITGRPADQRKPVGGAATFTVAAIGESAISYQWGRVQAGVTNALSDGGNVSGSSTETLTLTNLQLSDNGTYVVTVSNLAGSQSASAALSVKTPEDYVNLLDNPGFEDDPTGVDDSPWIRFEDATAGYLQSRDDQYAFGGNVNVHDGDWVSFTTFNGAYSGMYQDQPAEPGQIFTGDMWAYNATGDPIPGGGSVSNECFLEVQFREGETVLQNYTSDYFDHTAARDVWFHLEATNAGGFGISPPTSDSLYLVAPPNTTKVRFQITMHDIAGSLGQGSLYYDTASLMLKIPVELDVSEEAGSVQLTWETLAATDYQVQYSDDPNANTWIDEEVVPGTGGTVSRSYPAGGASRIYRVLTL